MGSRRDLEREFETLFKITGERYVVELLSVNYKYSAKEERKVMSPS
jgi:hypothetical protein